MTMRMGNWPPDSGLRGQWPQQELLCAVGGRQAGRELGWGLTDAGTSSKWQAFNVCELRSSAPGGTGMSVQTRRWGRRRWKPVIPLSNGREPCFSTRHAGLFRGNQHPH